MGTADPMFSSLSAAERNLIRLMQSVGTGRLMQLPVQDGQPLLEPPMTVVRLVKLRRNASDQHATVTTASDFALRREVLDLLTEIRAMKHGTIERLEILHGLPTTVEIAQPLSTSIPALVR